MMNKAIATILEQMLVNEAHTPQRKAPIYMCPDEARAWKQGYNFALSHLATTIRLMDITPQDNTTIMEQIEQLERLSV